MYYITPKNSETGRKFQIIQEQAEICRKAQKALGDQLGFDEFRPAYWVVFGGISSCFMKEQPDKSIWKNVNNSPKEWMPRLNTLKGKNCNKLFKKLPVISIEELNSCIGFDGAPWKTIGFRHEKDGYFGFSINDDWVVSIPSDCEEITFGRYKEIFDK